MAQLNSLPAKSMLFGCATAGCNPTELPQLFGSRTARHHSSANVWNPLNRYKGDTWSINYNPEPNILRVKSSSKKEQDRCRVERGTENAAENSNLCVFLPNSAPFKTDGTLSVLKSYLCMSTWLHPFQVPTPFLFSRLPAFLGKVWNKITIQHA